MKPLRYFFYRNYLPEARRHTPLAWVVPLILTAVMCALNLLCIAAVAAWAIGVLGEGKVDLGDARLVFIVTLGALFALLYVRWIASGRYLSFHREFGSESKTQTTIRTVLLFAYGLVSVGAPMLVGYVVRPG
jgi:hypothetical protein